MSEGSIQAQTYCQSRPNNNFIKFELKEEEETSWNSTAVYHSSLDMLELHNKANNEIKLEETRQRFEPYFRTPPAIRTDEDGAINVQDYSLLSKMSFPELPLGAEKQEHKYQEPSLSFKVEHNIQDQSHVSVQNIFKHEQYLQDLDGCPDSTFSCKEFPLECTSVKLYQCGNCDYKSKNKHLFLRHWRINHNSRGKLYKCEQCDYSTKAKGTFTAHIKHKHDVCAEVFKCSHCDYASKYKTSLNRHFRCQHDDSTVVFKCCYCAYSTKRVNKLKEHFSRIHDDCAEILKCSYCDYTTKLKRDLKLHVKHKHDDSAEVFQCSYCDYSTKRKGNLTSHVKCKH